MLKNLYIKDFILIEELSLSFNNGFSVFTGETGAGKSIMIDAISLLSSERANTSLIMKNKDKAIIEGNFDISKDDNAKKVLEEAGFDIEDEMIFTREIMINGKSNSRINHRIVTLALMKEALKNQIDIHNQRDNAYLLNANNHIKLLDKYANDNDLLNEVNNAYKDYKALIDEKNEVLNNTFNESDLEYFNYQINEINNANLRIGEDIELEEKEKEYKAVKKSFDNMNDIITLYQDNISGSLFEINNKTSNLDDTFDVIKTSINDSYYAIDDAISSLQSYLSTFDFSEDSINKMEERIFLIQKLKRKYNTDIEGILNLKSELEAKIDYYNNKQEFLNNIDTKINKALDKYTKVAKDLTKIRKNKAKELDKEIIKHLKDLGLDKAKFETNVSEKNEPSQDGNNGIEFFISMNKDENLKPLNKTASGGELSRLMLGLKVIFTNLQGIETIIFDEIDTGVSGRIASEIGHKMKELANNTQVFSVTHLAQVASCADYHYKVDKSSIKDKVYTTVNNLNKDEIIEELALISTGKITEASLKAAKELYQRNQI